MPLLVLPRPLAPMSMFKVHYPRCMGHFHCCWLSSKGPPREGTKTVSHVNNILLYPHILFLRITQIFHKLAAEAPVSVLAPVARWCYVVSCRVCIYSMNIYIYIYILYIRRHCVLVLLEYGSSHCLKLAAKACQGPYCAADCDPNETCL